MLRYDTVKDNIYHAYLMIVTTDAGSDTSPIAPCALFEWDATQNGFEHQFQHKARISDEESDEAVNRRAVEGIKIYTYFGLNGGNSFWRFKIEIPLSEREQEIFYSINVCPSSLFAFAHRLHRPSRSQDRRIRSGFPRTAKISAVCRVSPVAQSGS
jgi:hypothetical protein